MKPPVSYEEALSSKRGRSQAPELSHLRVSKAANGGHVVMHEFSGGEHYVEPKPHAFGKGEGKQMLAHIAKHMGIADQAEKEGEGAMAEEGETE